MSSAPARVATGSIPLTSRSNATRFTIVACALFAVLGIVTTLLGPILPFLTARWSISSAEAGTLFSWQFVASTIGTLLSGAALSKRGFRFPVLLGIGLCLVGVVALMRSNWTLGRYAVACYGFGLGVSLPAINLAVAEANPGKRAGSVSVLNFSWGIGAVVGPVLLRTMHSLSLFLLLTGVMLVAALVAASVSAMPPRTVNLTKEMSRLRDAKPFWYVAPLLALSMFLFCGVENAIAGWASSLALPSFSNAYAATSANIAFWTFFLLARALAPVALRFVSEAKLLIISIVLGAGGAIVFFLFAHPAVILFACGLAGLGIGPAFPLLIARVSEAIGPGRPAATICFAFAGFGAATLPTLMGIVGARFQEPRVELMVPFLALLLVLPASRWVAPSRFAARS
ncbi:MAG TPA: MFS transporter [Terriglobales bacterium]|nr:MFS transporter [Terriglobales bacterium]